MHQQHISPVKIGWCRKNHRGTLHGIIVYEREKIAPLIIIHSKMPPMFAFTKRNTGTFRIELLCVLTIRAMFWHM